MEKKIFAHLVCPICIEIASEPTTISCCGNVFCDSCISSCDRCPLCRSPIGVAGARVDKSPLARRIINEMPWECPDCGFAGLRQDTSAHQDACSLRKVKCPIVGCTRTMTRSELVAHAVAEHSEALLDLLTKSAVPNCLPDEHDPIGTKTNGAGRQARLGSNGKYYCGGPMRCSCCDGNCGPTNGCNCGHCMALDLSSRRLDASKYRVNNDGAVCQRQSNGTYYCGRKVMRGVPHCDGYCGPTNGPSCTSCQRIAQNPGRPQAPSVALSREETQ